MNLIPGSASIINGVFHLRMNALPKAQSGHTHWAIAGKARREWRHSACLYSKMVWRKPALTKCKITATRHSSVEPDRDNLSISTKSIIDGIKDAGVITDDKPSLVVEFRTHWVKAPPKKGYITVEVEEL